MRDFIRNIKWFFLNLFTLRKILWTYRPWDHYYINIAAAVMYKDMAKHILEHNNFIGSERTARRALVIAHLLEDDYSHPYYNKLIKEEFSLKREYKKDDCHVWDFSAVPESLKRRSSKARKLEDSIKNDRKQLLLKYLDKYHTSIWD